MKLYVFALRDSKSAQFGTPMFLQSEGVCVRSLSDEVNKNKESMVHQHPEDFELFYLGDWDTETCVFTLLPAPRSVVLCSSLKVGSA